MKKIKELLIKYREIISYLIVGGLTTVVSLSVYYGSVLTFLNPRNPVQLQAANVLSWIAAVTFAYFTNRKYVFRSDNKNIGREAFSFYCSRISTLLMDMGIMFLLVTVLSMNDKIAKLIVQVVVTIANYLFSKFFVFRRQEKSVKEPNA
ncbi:MAG: GtrA family protein [Eubacterium sp.]|nr:GtrA family protein [Eubacterium sp.]